MIRTIDQVHEAGAGCGRGRVSLQAACNRSEGTVISRIISHSNFQNPCLFSSPSTLFHRHILNMTRPTWKYKNEQEVLWLLAKSSDPIISRPFPSYCLVSAPPVNGLSHPREWNSHTDDNPSEIRQLNCRPVCSLRGGRPSQCEISWSPHTSEIRLKLN